MAQFCYDVVPHEGGFAIQVTPARGDAFPTQQAAFDAAAELARKLRFVGFALDVRMRDDPKGTGRQQARQRRAG